MFVSEALKTHLESSSTIRLQSLVLSEWNMNMPDNIYKIGNYRYRPLGSDVKFRTLPSAFDSLDSGQYYTDATNADIVIDGGYTDTGIPQAFTSPKEKFKLLYSLEDCIKPFRPRSGINKAIYLNNKFLANSGASIAQRPRYYMPSRYDEFKYWTSYRTEGGSEYGVANNISNSLYYINDSVPFVVYKDQVPANRLIVKMQTNVGDVDLGPFTTSAGSINDPLYGSANKTTPVRWKVQYLDKDNWVDAYSFDENSIRNNGNPIIGNDGYVELQYGLIIPDEYKGRFIYAETLASELLRPERSIDGYAYLIVENEGERGVFHVWNNLTEEYDEFTPSYGWIVAEETINNETFFVKDLTSPSSFINELDNGTEYREFTYLRGIRIVVETMNKFESTFDLIEMSPRLISDISDKVLDFKITKTLSDIGNTSLPVGQLLASNGKISLFDDDQAFNSNNTNSIIYKYNRKNIKFAFYEQIIDVDGYDYFVPIKTLYSEGFPQADISGATVSVDLRDLFFFLESMPAPRLLTTQTSLSYAISLLLDYIGFSNYTFKRVANESEPIIPFFFIAPDQNVAEVLNQLAISTQTAMFFDEYNNFVVMSKDYLMPSELQRSSDFILSGSNNQSDTGVTENSSSGILPNILSIASEDKKVFNSGKINYTTRYIQRSYGSIRQASAIDQDKTWIYKPALLWEVSGTESLKTINELASKQGSYVLGAMPINSDLTVEPPTVVDHSVINNVVDFGENVYWLTRYQGYFYANGEIIKYDAAEFNITGTGNVWISSNQEYQKYFSSLPFNGKIYPTGLVRIYSIPYYETVDGISRIKNGAVMQHGRAQFGTTISYHPSGLNQYWSNTDPTTAPVRGCVMSSEYLFDITGTQSTSSLSLGTGIAGSYDALARKTTRTGIIKNFTSTNYLTETVINNLKSTQSGTIQSSALVVTGPTFRTTENPIDFISYIYKPLDFAYKHFGTRMRIIGKIENNPNRSQTPIGSSSYYQVTGSATDQNVSVGGGSGGLAFLLNPETNNGYYFEIAALSESNIQGYTNAQNIHNILFYKIVKKNGSTSTEDAIPVKLWGGLSQITVDDGRFTGQYRSTGEERPTVYDLSVEYKDIDNVRRFFLYVNNKLIKVVDDPNPLPTYNNCALFVRGSSKLMFENLYALSENYADNSVFTVTDTLAQAFGDNQIDAEESFRKYALSGMVQATYLSGISPQQPPKYKIYFEEFGTIMRECSYFNIKYDRAYPALHAELSPTFNRIKGYTVSGFQADSYGAEFLIFNATDKALILDETTGNYLRIQGVTFTQDTTHELTVDEYFSQRSNMSDPELSGSSLVYSPLVEESRYNEIKLSRMIYGKNEFSIDSPYLQTDDDANALMGWIVNKIMVPKKSIGINLFSIPTLQLGDIVTVNYKDSNGLDLVSDSTTRFVVYNIEYSRNNTGPSMSVYLSEV
jgi:hypothetical protein